MSKLEIRVVVPATVANVGAGFDIFGFALEIPAEEMVVRLTENPAVVIKLIEGDGGLAPWDPEKNSASVSARHFLTSIGHHEGCEIEIYKKIKPGSGLGSSGASAAGSVYALNLLLDCPFSVEELIPYAVEGERSACGSAHADNVAPALLGGFTLIRSYDPLDVIQIPCQFELFCAVILPDLEIPPGLAREMLPKEISIEQLVNQSGNVGGIVAGLILGREDIFGRSIEDVFAEPIRSALIPGYQRIKSAALEKGALGCSLAGSGPSIFAATTSFAKAKEIGTAMAQACQEQAIECMLYVTQINHKGTTAIF